MFLKQKPLIEIYFSKNLIILEFLEKEETQIHVVSGLKKKREKTKQNINKRMKNLHGLNYYILFIYIFF